MSTAKKVVKKVAKKAVSKKASTNKQAENKPDDEKEETYKHFKELVNMSASQLEKWLKTEESKNTGWDSGDGEAIGHKEGKKIVEMLSRKKNELTNEDYHQMSRVISYISRHKAQKPSGDAENTKWNFSLKNWGYDYKK